MKQLKVNTDFEVLYNNAINKKLFIYKYPLNAEQLEYVKKNLVIVFNQPDLIYLDELEDACEMAMYIDFYPLQDITIGKKILISKVDSIIKISFLDLLFVVNKRIPQNEFIELNEVLRKSTNKLLSFQSKLNLVLYDQVSPSQIIKLLKKESIPTLVYRFLRTLNESTILVRKFKMKQFDIIEVIESDKFTDGIKVELMRLYKRVFK